MSSAPLQPVLYVITCGGPPAGQLPQFVSFAQEQGWDVCVIATPDGAKFVDADGLASQTGHPVRVEYKQPDAPDVLPPADAFVVAPATFNTVNKLAGGISDTLALGLTNEAVGMGLPIVVVPWPDVYLARHPVFGRSVASLREWGVTVILDPARLPQATKEPALFPWEELRAELTTLRTRAHAARVTSSRRLVTSGSPLEPEVGFSRAVRSGPYVCVSGTAPIADGGGTAAPGDVYAQSVRCLDIAEQALQEAGASLENVVRTRVMLTDIRQWRQAARAHAERFVRVRPACTFVEVSRFVDPEWLVEFEVDAIVPG